MNKNQHYKTIVAPPGFEPELSEPKSDVLPLHHRAMNSLCGHYR